VAGRRGVQSVGEIVDTDESQSQSCESAICPSVGRRQIDSRLGQGLGTYAPKADT